MSWKRIWWIALVAKLVLGAVIPISNDEAYYWVWGQHLQLSYYDHPPAIAWLFYLARPLDAIRDVIPAISGIVRWPTIVLGHTTILVLLRFLGAAASERQKKLLLGILFISPLFGIGSLIATPDIPYIFFWSLSLWAFQKYYDQPCLKNSVALGAALGMGFCAKYLIVIFVPIAMAFSIFRRRWDLFRLPFLLSAICTGLVFSAPVLIWNAQHEWISFKFQLNHGLDQEALTVERQLQQLLEYLGGQAALLGPLLLVVGFGLRLAKEHRLLIWMGWGPLVFFAWTSLRSPVEANWPIAGHLALLTAAAIVSGREDQSGRIAKMMMVIWALATGIVLFQTTRPNNSLFGIKADRLKTYEFVRYKSLERKVQEYPMSTPMYASSYQMAGALSFAAHRVVPKLAGINRVDFFDFHPLGIPSVDEFYVTLENEWPWPSWIAERQYFEISRERFDRFTIVHFKRKRNFTPETKK